MRFEDGPEIYTQHCTYVKQEDVEDAGYTNVVWPALQDRAGALQGRVGNSYAVVKISSSWGPPFKFFMLGLQTCLRRGAGFT